MNGKLGAEGWFDVEKLRSADRHYGTDVLNRLSRGEKIELSTGLYTDNEAAPPDSVCPVTGRQYTHVARNYRADHVAVLPDQVGACSVSDGCGVNNSNPEGNNQYTHAVVRTRFRGGATIVHKGTKDSAETAKRELDNSSSRDATSTHYLVDRAFAEKNKYPESASMSRVNNAANGDPQCPT